MKTKQTSNRGANRYSDVETICVAPPFDPSMFMKQPTIKGSTKQRKAVSKNQKK